MPNSDTDFQTTPPTPVNANTPPPTTNPVTPSDNSSDAPPLENTSSVFPSTPHANSDPLSPNPSPPLDSLDQPPSPNNSTFPPIPPDETPTVPQNGQPSTIEPATPTPPAGPPPLPPAEPDHNEPPNMYDPDTNSTPSDTPPPTPANPSKIKRSPFRIIIPVVVALLLIIGIVFAAIAFLPKLFPSQPEEITLTYWGLWEPTDNLQAIFSDFETQNEGITINYIQQSPKDYRERLQSAISKNQGPDIFRFHNTWLPMFKQTLDPIPSNVFSNSEFESTFYPNAARGLRSGSSYVGIPLMYDGLALYYNTRIFDSAGKTPPKTWEDFRNTAAQLTLRDDKGNIIRGGAAIGTTSNVDHWPDILAVMMLQNGANPAAPTSEAAYDALAFYTLMARGDNVWDDTLPNSTFAFATEKATMMIGPSWRAHDITAINSELEFATAPLPQLPGTNINWATYWVEGVASNIKPDKKVAAWKFLKYLSQRDTLTRLYSTASQNRLFGAPYPRVDMASELTDDPLVGAYIKTAPTAQSWYLSSWTHDNGLNDRIIKYYEDAVNQVLAGASPNDALETTVQGVAQVLSQYGVTGALSQ